MRAGKGYVFRAAMKGQAEAPTRELLPALFLLLATELTEGRFNRAYAELARLRDTGLQ